MKRFTILSICRNTEGRDHTYIMQLNERGEETGEYLCNTLQNDTKILNDFLFLNNCNILSIKDKTKPNNPIFRTGDTVTIGANATRYIVDGFRINRNHIEIHMRGVTNYINIENIHKFTPTTTVATAVNRAATTEPTVSRSTNPFVDLQEKILSDPREIRLEKTLRSRKESLKDFLIKFFKDYNENKNTIYVDDKSIQTDTGRRRSLGDIFRICKYYYPECTLKDILILLYREIPIIITRGFRTSYCSTIKKRVWYYDNNDNNTVANLTTKDEYGNIVSFYTSKL